MSYVIVEPARTASLPVNGHGAYCFGGIVVALGESWDSGQYWGTWLVINGEKGFAAKPLGSISGIGISKGSNGIVISSPNNTTYVYACFIGRRQ